MSNTTTINNCQICKKKTTKVLSLGLHPLCDDLIKINSKKKNQEYPIIIQYCKNCRTAFQKHQVKKSILFPKSYHYRAKLTQDVINGQKDLIREIKNNYKSLKGKKILDIGCNDGALLDNFKKEKAITIGIEPTNAYKDASKKHKIYNNYLDRRVCSKILKKFGNIDFITFTNVFAHINNLSELLKNLRKLTSKDTTIIIENHYLGSVIQKRQFDTFYHEHPRTYSLTSFVKIAKIMDLNLEKFSFPKRYGGNIRVFLSKKKIKSNFKKKVLEEKKFYKKLINLQKLINIWKINKQKKILSLNKKYGPLPAKAFPGRAAILLKLLKLNTCNINSVYEKNNSKKIGYYVPSTRIPIVADSGLKKIKKKVPIINFAWHIDKEIKKYLKKLKFYNKVISILEKKDFR